MLLFLYFSTRLELGEGVVDQGIVSKLQSSLERVEKELQETKERKASLERECVIYQSQLNVSGGNSLMSIILVKLIVEYKALRFPCIMACFVHFSIVILWW